MRTSIWLKKPRKRDRWPHRPLEFTTDRAYQQDSVASEKAQIRAELLAESRRLRRERIWHSPHWRKGRFWNLETTQKLHEGHWGILYRYATNTAEREPRQRLPLLKVDTDLLAARSESALRITWLGHSSLYLEIEGYRVLCDPIWSERSSPLSFIGPRRFQPPPVALPELPDPDLVLISHNHYDHLDEPTIRSLADRAEKFAVPLGVGELLEEWGISPARIIELDWWEAAEVLPDGLRVIATPSRHFSGRVPFSHNATLWASWVIQARAKRVFFGGDGGFSSSYADIGRQFGPFDLAMLEIGAYDAAWADIHSGPINALRANELLGANVFLPIHWGTFNLALHPWYEPIEMLLNANDNGRTNLALPQIGETFMPEQRLPSKLWWRQVMN